MGPRMDDHVAPSSVPPVEIGNHSHNNEGIDSSHTTISVNSTSQMHQRRKDYSMQESSSSVLSSSTYLVVEESSSGDTNTSNHNKRTLMVSESQSSLGDTGSFTSGFPLSDQSQFSKILDFRPRLILAWTLHFACCIIILWYGTSENHGERKYIPIDTSKVDDDCVKAFVDVFSSSMDDPNAFVCCRSTSNSSSGNASIKNPLICNPPPSYLPFARRLARFPDAWLLPLFPLLVRGGWQLYCNYAGKYSMSKLDSTYSKRRLYLYLGLIQIRGWILYLVFDEVEDYLVQSADKECWYEEYLHPHYHHCQGRMTDFSDHVVLYFAQILPIALMEILHSFSIPYWLQQGGRGLRKSNLGADTKGRHHHYHHLVVPMVLVLWLTNLYIVTFIGAYKTAAYFHTGPEVVLGFLVSLLIQLPVCLLQCHAAFTSHREYFFGPAPL